MGCDVGGDEELRRRFVDEGGVVDVEEKWGDEAVENGADEAVGVDEKVGVSKMEGYVTPSYSMGVAEETVR